MHPSRRLVVLLANTMNSLRAFLLRSVSRRLPNLLATAGRAKALYPVPRLFQPHVGGHATFRPQSTRPNKANDKRPRAGKKPELTKEEREERKKKKDEKRKRLVKRFNKFIGKRKLGDWQKLCRTIDLEGEFNDVESCRKAIESVYVNIEDVLDADEIIQAGGKARPQRFPTPWALTKYTVEQDKIYPRNKVTEDQPEYAMLRHIFDPQSEEKLQREREERLRKKKEAKLKRKKEAKLKKKENSQREKQEKEEKEKQADTGNA